jgi:hypothetical protein
MKGLGKWAPVALLLFLLSSPNAILASDHRDSPATDADPIADILDVYAFMEPYCRTSGGVGCEAPPEELILVMTAHPEATSETKFSEQVSYHFHFENDVGVSQTIDCSFSADQMVTCAGLNGLSVTAPVGQPGVNGDIRVYAGLRDDPFFMDIVAFNNFTMIGMPAFSDPGTDGLAGANVMAVVLGIKNASFPAGSGAKDANGHAINVQKFWVSSKRTSGSGINGGISGSWFNPAQDGQGWVIEVISTPSGDQFLFYFYGYDDDGNRLWLIGITDDLSGSSVTVEALLFTGTGFGGNFDPSSVDSEVAGTVTFEFNDCNSGKATFNSTKEGLDSFMANMQRLSSISSLECNFSAGTMAQIDRKGRPMVTGFLPEEKRDAYNAASDPSTWVADYSADIEASLTAIDLADGIEGNSFLDPADMAALMADDRLRVDLEWAQCGGIYTIEFSDLVPQPHTNDCGGRQLSTDVVDDFLSTVVSGFDPWVSDFVGANDKAFLTEFPFLAAPH